MNRGTPEPGSATQASLDAGQYTRAEILKYEAVYGRDFISPGGLRCARRFIGLLKLAAGAHVLDAGCGLGGSALVMAREHHAAVMAIDLSSNMIALARERCREQGLDDRIEFVLGDCLALEQRGVFDVVYSRDAFLHIADKARLFAVLLRALKPGGQILFTDYCAAPEPWSEAFTGYVRERGYDLHSVPAYAQLLTDAGFERVEAQDLTAEFAQIHERELDALASADIAQSDRTSLQQAWQTKLARIRAGEQRWGLFRARRAL